MKSVLTFATRAALATGLLLASSLAQAELAIIAHPSNPLSSISQEDVERIYLGKSRSFPNGGSARPIDQAPGSAMRTKFFSSMLKKTEAQVTGYWSRRMFSGKGKPPETLDDDQAVKSQVASDTSSIGYISDEVVDSSVKVLLLVP